MKSRKNKSAVNTDLSAGTSVPAIVMSAPHSFSVQTSRPYIGRFAPSPTGLLHFGSLVSAVASFMDARAHQGIWLVRMEDLDPPREQRGAAAAILEALEQHGLISDQEVMFQSQRLDAYRIFLESLKARQLVYACDCSRQDLQLMGGIYDGRCRIKTVDTRQPHAWRLKLYEVDALPSETLTFEDIFQGEQQQNLRREAGDQILRRKDNLFAYQLAVVADDMMQGVTHVVRGLDLLEVTARQIALFTLCGYPPPRFGHVPMAVNRQGQKLSKQNLALPLDGQKASGNLWYALEFLGQNPPATLRSAMIDEILQWGISHWRREPVAAMPRQALSPLSSGEE